MMSRHHWSVVLAVCAGLLVATAPLGCHSTDEPTDPDDQTEEDADTGDNDDETAEDATDDTDEDADTRPDDVPDCRAWLDDRPRGLMLTWQRDPTSTMTIDWHAIDAGETDDDADDQDADNGADPTTTLCVREAGTEYWEDEIEARPHEVPHLERTLYRLELTDLQPGTEYVFQTGAFDREYRFRTMPEDIEDEPLQFAAGGDTQHLPDMFEATNEAVMEYDLDFVIWGGDFSYADGGTDPTHDDRWRWWFDAVAETLVYDDGRAVPIIGAIGNHEVRDFYIQEYDDPDFTEAWRTTEAPYFYTFFAFPGQPGYGVLDFGDYLSIIALDSDHTNPVDGQQTGWLDAVLGDRAGDVPHIFPLYHVAAFPSHRDFDGEIPTRIREHWIPKFEQHDLEIVFEKHDHTYKRTPPIRDGEVDEDDGITYVGDGAWGVLPRVGASRDAWYIEEFESTLHGIIVTLEGDRRHLKSVDSDGEIIDQFGNDID